MDFIKEKQKIAMNSWETWHIDFFGSSTFQGEKGNLYISDQILYPKKIIILFLQYYFKHFYWSIVGLQCCVSLYCTTEWISCVCVLVAQSCLSLCNHVDYNLPSSSVHGIFQVRILEWVAISFSRECSQPKDQTQVSSIAGRFFTVWAIRIHIFPLF